MYTLTGRMLISKFDTLRRKKAYEEGRDLPLRTVSAETGLSFATLQRFSKSKISAVSGTTLEILCAYFDVKSISELVEYVKDAPATVHEQREGDKSG